MMRKGMCSCLHTRVHWRHRSWSIFLGTICGCSRIWNSLRGNDSHDLILSCYVTRIVLLLCIAVCVIASVPRLVITCSLSVSVSLCQMKRENRCVKWNLCVLRVPLILNNLSLLVSTARSVSIKHASQRHSVRKYF